MVQRADVDGGKRKGLSTAEREELSRLRRQVRVLEEERSIVRPTAVAGQRLARHPHAVAGAMSHTERHRLERR